MTTADDVRQVVHAQLQAAAATAPLLAGLSTDVKNQALGSMADALLRRRYAILEANHEDVSAAHKTGETGARLERLTLTETGIHDMVKGLQAIAALPDPVGEVLESFRRPNGLAVQKVRVPMGVIAVIYESRPNVTVDSAGLTLKTGNAVVLRGGKEALLSNRTLVQALREGLQDVGVSKEAIQFVGNPDRSAVDAILAADHLVDLAIPRGGAGLIQRVKEQSRVPVIETGVGNCHVYVHATANLAMATDIVVNAKTQRPSVCNALETLLLDVSVVQDQTSWLASLATILAEKGVELRVDPDVLIALQRQQFPAMDQVALAADEDYATEFLGLILAIKTVANLDDALAHIQQFGTKHSESIITEDSGIAERFLRSVDAAAVYHNASTRFTDGSEFGFGAEIGISTQKLHARGPMGLRELCSYKYVVRGEGQIR